MTLYLDTNRVVKLYVLEPGSEVVRRPVQQATVVVTFSLAHPETRAALARRRRERALTTAAFTRTTRAFQDDWPRHLAPELTPAFR